MTITFLPDAAGVKMIYSGTITGRPHSFHTGGSPGTYKATNQLSADNGNDGINGYFTVTPTTNIFTGGTDGMIGNGSIGATFFLYPAPNPPDSRLYVVSNASSQTVSGQVIFPNYQISDIGTVLTSTYTLVGTTGGSGGTPDRVFIQVDPGSPTVTSVTPDIGPVAGGTSVTIAGTNLMGTTAVSFGSNAASSFTVDSASQITATVPAGSGTVDVSVTTPVASASLTGGYTYVDAPVVSSLDPATGPTAGGTHVTINGTGFTGATAVTIGGAAAATYTVLSATQITAVTPAGTAGAADVIVTTAAGTSLAGTYFTYMSPTPQDVFDDSRDAIRRILQDQALKRLSTLMGDNDRMMQDVRTRFIGFAQGKEHGGLTEYGFGSMAFDVDATVDAEGGSNGIVAASNGAFLGQTGMVNGVNWRLSGNFDVIRDGEQWLTAFDGRLAREQFITRNLLWGAFGGGQFSRSKIADSFIGSETTWQLYGGTYAVGQIASNLFADGYAGIGYGQSDLGMNNDVLTLDSTYGSLTWQVGGSLVGLIKMQGASLLPTVSVAYGNSNLGVIDLTAQAYGVSDAVSLDADYVAMGVLRLTPELRVPIAADATVDNGLVLGLFPSLICQQVEAENSETRCGWGLGAEFVQDGSSGIGQFSSKIDFQQIGGTNQIGGKISYSIQF